MQMGQLWKYAVAGNIKKSHLDENGIERYGTLAFTGNTKVYLCGKIWNNERKEIAVLGLCRGKRYYVDRVPVDLIENVRMTKVYTPKVLEIMSNWEFADGWWGNSEDDKKDVLNFVEAWKKR